MFSYNLNDDWIIYWCSDEMYANKFGYDGENNRILEGTVYITASWSDFDDIGFRIDGFEETFQYGYGIPMTVFEALRDQAKEVWGITNAHDQRTQGK